MDRSSAHEPLLSNGVDANSHFLKKKRIFLVPFLKWVLKLIIWATFVAWATFFFLYPIDSVYSLYRKWLHGFQGTAFGVAGGSFLVFSGPVLAIALLAIVYLILCGDEEFQEKKHKRYPNFRLWTFPVLVDGPFGVVSAAELIGILIFCAYVIWAITIYTIRTFSFLPDTLPSKLACSLMLEITGLRCGLIGLFFLVFLFLPVARGSALLRLIDIPFEHATKYHVWLGHLTMMLFTLHGLLYMIGWAMQGRLLNQLLEWKDIGIANLAGVISLIAGLFMWVTSLPPVRKQNFELFFYTHQLYIVFVVFLALHVGDFIFSMAGGGIFLFTLDRFLRFCQSRRTVDIVSATCLPCGTLELVLSKPESLRYNALSFIFLQVRELSWLQWHPFSVSSSPLDGKHHLSVLIKVLGSWTAKLRRQICEESAQTELHFRPPSKITVSVEGPYGHESPYHLSYGNLILVAGGIGISPFLAILRDIFHRMNERTLCLPEKILIVWAVKTSDELHLLSIDDMKTICPSHTAKISLETQIYVTREAEPALEEGKVQKKIYSCVFPVPSGHGMSALVGTGDNIWSGVYVLASTIGFILLVALLNIYYINAYNIYAWWYKGLLILVCMVASVTIFGGLVVGLWNLWETSSARDKNPRDTSQRIDGLPNVEPTMPKHASQENITGSNLASSRTIAYGRRPDFREIFGSVSKRWGHVDIGVIVCGPPTLQSSVAKECRSMNLYRRSSEPIFHFNSHSFDL